MRVGVVVAWVCVGSLLSCFSRAADPEVGPVAYSLEGRIVWCRGEEDEGTKGFQFREWIAFVNNTQPKPYISIHFRPRFLKCKEFPGPFYGWVEDADYRKENRLAAGFYEPGWFGSERIQFMDEAEFPALEDTEERVYLRYYLQTFFAKKEWSTLREKKQLVKRAILFPWPKDRWDSPGRGIPGDVLSYGAWYELTLNFEMRADSTLHVAEPVAVHSGAIRAAAKSSRK